jgi:hypothetical protein
MVSQNSRKRLADVSNNCYDLVCAIGEDVPRNSKSHFDHIMGGLLPPMRPFEVYFDGIDEVQLNVELERLKGWRDYVNYLFFDENFRQGEFEIEEGYFPDIQDKGYHECGSAIRNYAKELKERMEEDFVRV